MVQNPGINLLDGGPPVHEAGCVVAQAGLREDAHSGSTSLSPALLTGRRKKQRDLREAYGSQS